MWAYPVKRWFKQRTNERREDGQGQNWDRKGERNHISFFAKVRDLTLYLE